MGTSGQLGIDGVIRDHRGSIVKAYSKLTGDGFAIEVEVAPLMEGLVLAKALGR